MFAEVVPATVFACSELCTSEEQNLVIYLARKPLMPLNELWDELQHYG
jgi:hypothetical protein